MTPTDKTLADALIEEVRSELEHNQGSMTFTTVRSFVSNDAGERNPNEDGSPFMDFKKYRVTVECLGLAGEEQKK